MSLLRRRIIVRTQIYKNHSSSENKYKCYCWDSDLQESEDKEYVTIVRIQNLDLRE